MKLNFWVGLSFLFNSIYLKGVYSAVPLTFCIRGNSLTSTFVNSEDPDEMQHNATLFGKVKLTKEYNIFF